MAASQAKHGLTPDTTVDGRYTHKDVSSELLFGVLHAGGLKKHFIYPCKKER